MIVLEVLEVTWIPRVGSVPVDRCTSATDYIFIETSELLAHSRDSSSFWTRLSRQNLRNIQGRGIIDGATCGETEGKQKPAAPGITIPGILLIFSIRETGTSKRIISTWAATADKNKRETRVERSYVATQRCAQLRETVVSTGAQKRNTETDISICDEISHRG